MKKIHLIVLSLLTVSLITHCPASSSGNPTNGTQPPTDITPARTIHVHVRDDVSNNTEVVDLTDSITVAEPTYSILEGNDANIFSIDSSTGVITIADANKITYDGTSGANNNNVHLLKVRASDGSDSTKITEAPLRIVVRGFGGAFITTWTTTGTDETITIPTIGTGYDFTVDWGDSSAETTYTGDATHTYAAPNTYTVIITGDFPRIYFNNAASDMNGDNKTKIQSVEQWGSTAWTSMVGAFNGASNLTVPAVDAPDLTDVTSMTSMFANATSFNQEINHWDTSSIESMRSIFLAARAFNQNIGEWDTSSVNDMNAMFLTARAFNQDISDWNTAKVTNMSSMFSTASAFNQNIGAWETGMVNDMSSMFSAATVFNQDISGWDTAMVEDMGFMFINATAFNQPIGTWNTAKVTDMSRMFNGASAFNQPIATDGNSWNTAMVNDMNGMFGGARAFNQDIGDWNTGMVENMSNMFNNARAFNQDIGDWNTAEVTDMSNMFNNARAFNRDISTSGNSWNTGMVENMSNMFLDATAFNQDISNWNTGMVENMSNMFLGASAFNQNISGWTVSAVTAAGLCSSFATNSALATGSLPPFVSSCM